MSEETMCPKCREIAARVCDEEARRLRLEASKANLEGRNVTANLLIGKNETAQVCESLIRAIPTTPDDLEKLSKDYTDINELIKDLDTPLEDDVSGIRKDTPVVWIVCFDGTPNANRTFRNKRTAERFAKSRNGQKASVIPLYSSVLKTRTNKPVTLPAEPKWLTEVRALADNKSDVIEYIDALKSCAEAVKTSASAAATPGEKEES